MLRGVDPVEALDRLLVAAEGSQLDALCERCGVRLLGAFGSAVARLRDPESPEPADLDLAVSFVDQGGSLLHLLDGLAELTDYDGIDLARLDGAEPVLRAEAFSGVGLYERTAGAWAVAQMAALAEFRDTAHLRRMDLEALAG